jgi:DnaK suppressor protein
MKAKLLRSKAELRELEATLEDAGKTVELDQTRVGRLSRMDAMQAQQMALEASRRRRQQIAEIDTALRVIEKGDYGYCIECGDEIDVRRLEVAPANPRCMTCIQNSE